MSDDELITRIRTVTREHGLTTAAGLIAFLHERLITADRQVIELQTTNTMYVGTIRELHARVQQLEAREFELEKQLGLDENE